MAASLLGSRYSSLSQRHHVAARSASAWPASVRPFTSRRPTHWARIRTSAAEEELQPVDEQAGQEGQELQQEGQEQEEVQQQQEQGEQEEEEGEELEADEDDLDGIFEDMDEIRPEQLQEETLLDEEGNEVELDEDEELAAAYGEFLAANDPVDAAAELTVASQLGLEEEEIQEVRLRGELLFAEAAAGRGGTAEEREHVLEATANRLVEEGDVPELGEDDVDDIQMAHGYTKFDEDSGAGLSAEQRAIIEPYKLSKAELKNLLPSTWDTINIDWFTDKRSASIPLPEYRLNLLWTEKNLGVAVDQVYSRGQSSPLTEYFVWPRADAWEELSKALEARPWILERDRVTILNRMTTIINLWQTDEARPSIEAAREAFPDCVFLGD